VAAATNGKTAEPGSKSKKISLAQFLICTRMPRTLGKGLSAMRSTEEGAHRWMVEVNGEIQCCGRRDGSWAAKLSARGQ
jgi:hypothetical protein